MSSTAQYQFDIDFDNSGAYSTAENVTADVLSAYSIKISRGRDQLRQLAPPMVGTAEFELDNVARKYSRENSTGPNYGNLLPGRPVRIQATWDSTTNPLFEGHLSELTPHIEIGRRSVSIAAYGPLAKLRAQAEGNKISTALYASIRTDTALGYILDAIGWPAADRVLDTGKTTMDWWWLSEEDAFEAAKTLLATEGPGAALYEDEQGRIVFESRHYRITTARCTDSQVTFNSTGATEPGHSEPFTYSDGIKDVINLCTVEQKVRTAAGSTSEVWALGSTLTLGASETRQVKAKGSDPFQLAVSPTTSGSDYTLSAGSLSSAIGLDRASGQNCTLTVKAGSAGATLTGLRLRAVSVPVTATNLLSNTVSSTASQDKYGIRAYPLPVRAEVAVNTVQDFCNAVTGLYKEPRPVVEITVVGQTSQRLEQIFDREISDRITVLESQVGTTGAYFIERIEHNIQYGGLWHETRFGAEAVWTQPFARWGSSGVVYTRWASTGFTSTDTNKGVWGY